MYLEVYAVVGNSWERKRKTFREGNSRESEYCMKGNFVLSRKIKDSRVDGNY